jgi:hypothetical protein
VRDILDSQNFYQDESMSLVAPARELYGRENWFDWAASQPLSNGTPLLPIL